MRDAASRPSRRSSFVAYEPRPGRNARAPAPRRLRRRCPARPAPRRPAPPGRRRPPVPSTSTPISRSSAFAVAPAATIAAVCLALARSSASRTSVSPYFSDPARSACPGRGSVTGSFPLPAGSPSGGQGLIPQAQFSWSRFRTTSASGVPSVRPCLRPASTSTRSVSIRWRGLRPYPCWRRSRSRSIASRSSTSPAGRPVTIATSAGPCDSPAVVSARVTSGRLVPPA